MKSATEIAKAGILKLWVIAINPIIQWIRQLFQKDPDRLPRPTEATNPDPQVKISLKVRIQNAQDWVKNNLGGLTTTQIIIVLLVMALLKIYTESVWVAIVLGVVSFFVLLGVNLLRDTDHWETICIILKWLMLTGGIYLCYRDPWALLAICMLCAFGFVGRLVCRKILADLSDPKSILHKIMTPIAIVMASVVIFAGIGHFTTLSAPKQDPNPPGPTTPHPLPPKPPEPSRFWEGLAEVVGSLPGGKWVEGPIKTLGPKVEPYIEKGAETGRKKCQVRRGMGR